MSAGIPGGLKVASSKAFQGTTPTNGVGIRAKNPVSVFLPFADLLPELQIKIFQLLPINTLVACRKISQGWKQLISSENLLQKRINIAWAKAFCRGDIRSIFIIQIPYSLPILEKPLEIKRINEKIIKHPLLYLHDLISVGKLEACFVYLGRSKSNSS